MITIRNLSLLLLLAIGMSLPAAAQQTPTTDRDLSAEDYERMIQATYNVEFRKMVIDALEMTPEEISAFTPIYVEYMNTKADFVDRRNRQIEDFKDDLQEDDSIADKEEEAAGFLENYWEIDIAESELRKDYFDRLEDLIPVEKAISFFLLEDAVEDQMHRSQLGQFMPGIVAIRIPEGNMNNQMQQQEQAAATTPASAGETTADRDISTEDYERLIENTFRVNFRTLAIETLELSEEQITAFTPLYLEYMDRHADLVDRRMRLMEEHREEMSENNTAKSEANETADFIENLWEADIAESELRKDYFDRMEDAVTPEKAMQFFLLDDAVRGQLQRMSLNEVVPGMLQIQVPEMNADQNQDMGQTQDQNMTQTQPADQNQNLTQPQTQPADQTPTQDQNMTQTQPQTQDEMTARGQTQNQTMAAGEDDWELQIEGQVALDHKYTSQGLRKLVDAIDAMARKGNVTLNNWQSDRQRILQVADYVTRDWRSTDHADSSRVAFMLIADALQSMQQHQSFAGMQNNQINDLQSAARAVDPNVWQTRQANRITTFFNTAETVVNAMADQVQLRSQDVAGGLSDRN